MNSKKSQIFLLIRKISPYSGADILLRVFSHLLGAENERKRYIQKYKNNLQPDFWQKQAYKATVCLEEDVLIQEKLTDFNLNDNDLIYVVSNYFDALGQIARNIDSVYLEKEQAQKRIFELEELDSDNDGCVSYAMA